LLSNSEKHALRWRKYQSKYTMLNDREDVIGDQNVLLEKKNRFRKRDAQYHIDMKYKLTGTRLQSVLSK